MTTDRAQYKHSVHFIPSRRLSESVNPPAQWRVSCDPSLFRTPATQASFQTCCRFCSSRAYKILDSSTLPRYLILRYLHPIQTKGLVLLPGEWRMADELI